MPALAAVFVRPARKIRRDSMPAENVAFYRDLMVDNIKGQWYSTRQRGDMYPPSATAALNASSSRAVRL
jgi:hypothetical protein